MATRPTDPVRLSVTTVSKGTVEFLRFMTGREVRARVVRGGGTADTIQIRLGNHLVQARLSGQPLPTGLSLFVKVESAGQGGFRLVVLSGLPQSPPGVRLPPEIPAPLIRAFQGFLIAPEIRRIGSGPAPELPDSDLKSAVREAFTEVLNGLGIERGENVEIVFFDEWKDLDESGSGDQEQAPGRNPERQSNESEAEDPDGTGAKPDSEVAGWGRTSTRPVFFCVRIRLPVLGVIGLLITAADAGFEHASVYISPLRPAVARLLEKHLPAWEPILRERVPGLEFLRLAGPAETRRSPVDFSA